MPLTIATVIMPLPSWITLVTLLQMAISPAHQLCTHKVLPPRLLGQPQQTPKSPVALGCFSP
jgi:hypothetical protein